MKQQILRYWLAMNASAFDSAAITIKAFLGGAVAHTLSGDSIPGLNWAQLMSVLAVAFVWGIVNFIIANPIEKLFPVPK